MRSNKDLPLIHLKCGERKIAFVRLLHRGQQGACVDAQAIRTRKLPHLRSFGAIVCLRGRAGAVSVGGGAG